MESEDRVYHEDERNKDPIAADPVEFDNRSMRKRVSRNAGPIEGPEGQSPGMGDGAFNPSHGSAATAYATDLLHIPQDLPLIPPPGGME